MAVAKDVGVDDRLSAVEVSMLDDLTEGRRAELLNILGRFKQTSSGGMYVCLEYFCSPTPQQSARKY